MCFFFKEEAGLEVCGSFRGLGVQEEEYKKRKRKEKKGRERKRNKIKENKRNEGGERKKKVGRDRGE